MSKTITLHNTPEFYLGYMRNWLLHAEKDKKKSPAELLIVRDLATLVELGAGVLAPSPSNEGEPHAD